MADGESRSSKSDLGVRTLSAVVMLAVAGTALWLGGIVWTMLVALVGFGVIYEFGQLVRDAGFKPAPKAAWAFAALIYVGIACWAFLYIREIPMNLGLTISLFLLGIVIATDVGAYFAGRSIGGPKIAPKISPSKTWAGLAGGIILASLFAYAVIQYLLPDYPIIEPYLWSVVALAGSLAVVAQIGDFLESWLKRRAGVKDSGNLIPGHGGLFDRVDGLLAVMFVAGTTLIYFLATGRL